MFSILRTFKYIFHQIFWKVILDLHVNYQFQTLKVELIYYRKFKGTACWNAGTVSRSKYNDTQYMSRKYLLLKQKNISCKSRQLSWCCISCIAIPRSIWRQWIQGRCGSGDTAGRGLHGNGGECPCQQHLNTLATLHSTHLIHTRHEETQLSALVCT